MFKSPGFLLLVLGLFFSWRLWGQEETGAQRKTSIKAADGKTSDKGKGKKPSSGTEKETPPLQKPKFQGKLEKIEVTGSRIKRIDVEGPSPVLTLDQDYLRRTGYNNVADVLRDTTTASFGGGRESALSDESSTTSLRGFGADRILVLLDGKRLPTQGGSSTVDMSLIPMAAVESIDILKDGASAIYGSDALGGVINIKTRKDYDGASVEWGYTQPQTPGGTRTDLKLFYGKNFSKGEFLGALQYRHNAETWSRDYDYAIPSFEGLSPTGTPGTWIEVGTNKKNQPGGGEDPCPPDRVDDEGFCRFDYSPYSQILPNIKQYNSLLAGKYEINENMVAFARGIYTYRFATNQLAPPPDHFSDESDAGGINTQIPQEVAQRWGLNANADLRRLRYRPVEELGSRLGEASTHSYALHSGLEGSFWESWDWEFSATHSLSTRDQKGVRGYANKELLFEAAVKDPSEFNPFKAPGNKDNLEFARYQPLIQIDSSMSTINWQATGEVLDLSAGPMALAVGVSAAWQTYEESSDPITATGRQWGGGTSVNGGGSRQFQSVYGELSIPAFQAMEVQLAGRFDRFSDFGSTVNPKLGFRYLPLNWLSVRGSWGTGFRAPSLADLYTSQVIHYPSGTDPVTGFEGQFETLGGGNPELQEETSSSFNLGTVVQMSQNLSLVADYWQVSQANEVASLEPRDIFMAEQKLGLPHLRNLGVDVIRNPGNNRVERLVAPSVNLSSRRVNGLDLGLRYMLPVFKSYRLRASMDHSFIFEQIEEPFPGLGSEDRAGFFGRPDWRNNISLGLGNGTWDYSAMVRSIAGQDASASSPGSAGKMRDHTELDLRVQYRAPWKGTFSLLIQNVLDTDRPFGSDFLSSGFVNTDLYNPFGRVVQATYRQDF